MVGLTCVRDVLFVFVVIENYRSLVDIFWKTRVIGKLYYVRSADENVGRSVVDIFWKTEVIGKLYYVRSADENVGGSVVDIFWKNGRNWQAVLRAVSQRNEGGTVGVFCLFEGFNIFLLWVMQAGRPSWIDLINACL